MSESGFDLKQMQAEATSADRESEGVARKLFAAVDSVVGENDRGYKVREALCELTGSLAAGITGAVVWSVGTAATRGVGRAGSLGVAATLSGAVKFSVKSGLEKLLLPEEKRTASSADFVWGAVDGLSGVTASVAEKAVSQSFMQSLGRQHLGADISAKMAEMAGAKVIAGSITPQLKHNILRGVVGGAAGGLTWSVPHSLEANWGLIKEDPLSGLNAAKNQILSDTVTGVFLGGTLSGLGTVLSKAPEIIRHGAARVQGDAHVTRLDIAHLNDLHSELIGSHGLPRIATKLDELRAGSAAKGRDNHFYVAGDTESGNVIYSFTQGGFVENEALARLKVDGIIPGNHSYDVAGGGYDVTRYVGALQRVNENHRLPLLAANLDLSAYPEYARMVKPYVVHTVKGPGGAVEKVGVLGLITEDGAIKKIGFVDPVETAERYIAELHGQGIKKVVVLSHLGLTHDVELARRVKGISAIIGAHSHDFEPVPRWIRQGSHEGRQGLINRLKPASSDPFASWNVPIVQAGSNGRWLGELNLAFSPSGAADRYRTLGRLHPITNRVPADRDIERFIGGYLDELKGLKQHEYNSEAVAPYGIGNVRNRETPLGNLISDAMLSRLRKQLGDDSVDIVLMNSGAIRAGIKANDPITRLDLANIFMNAGKPHMETKELFLAKMTGAQIKDALEYGVHDMVPSQGFENLNSWQRLRRMMAEPKPPAYKQEPGNFLQVGGLRYSFDLSKDVRLPGQTTGGRVSDVLVEGLGGRLHPIVDDKVYTVATRLHALSRWHAFKVFGLQTDFRESLKRIGAENTRLSQVELLGEHIQGRTLDPMKLSRIDGRITELTPHTWEPTLRPGISIPALATLSARAPFFPESRERHAGTH